MLKDLSHHSTLFQQIFTVLLLLLWLENDIGVKGMSCDWLEIAEKREGNLFYLEIVGYFSEGQPGSVNSSLVRFKTSQQCGTERDSRAETELDRLQTLPTMLRTEFSKMSSYVDTLGISFSPKGPRDYQGPRSTPGNQPQSFWKTENFYYWDVASKYLLDRKQITDTLIYLKKKWKKLNCLLLTGLFSGLLQELHCFYHVCTASAGEQGAMLPELLEKISVSIQGQFLLHCNFQDLSTG